MPEITLVHVVLLVAVTLIGAISAWVVRGRQADLAKTVLSASWQERIDDERRENDRLQQQNKSLMEQVNQLQASQTDAKNRAKELSQVVQEAFERRDELQREIKDIRSNLETVLSERDQLQSDMQARGADHDLLAERDARIERLNRELDNWQSRLPPLVERFRSRNAEAEQLETDLAAARQRIDELESALEEFAGQQTRIEPVHNPEELTDGLDACNDPAGDDAQINGSDMDGILIADDATSVSEMVTANDDDDADDADFGADADDDQFAQRDDLKQIKGVGPAIEKTLNEMGIFNFDQIADLSEYEIDRVAKRLKGFRSRIYREDWIGQARELRDQSASI